MEVNFHDYEPAARYLIDHQDEQADAIVQAIAETLGLEEAGAEEAAQKALQGRRYCYAGAERHGRKRKKQGRLFGGGRWTIYEDRYTVKQDSRADGRTVLAGEKRGHGRGGVRGRSCPYRGRRDRSRADAGRKAVPRRSRVGVVYGGCERARRAGIVNGYPDGTFKPEQTATRAEVAVMLYRALEKQKEKSLGQMPRLFLAKE